MVYETFIIKFLKYDSSPTLHYFHKKTDIAPCFSRRATIYPLANYDKFERKLIYFSVHKPNWISHTLCLSHTIDSSALLDPSSPAFINFMDDPMLFC